MALDLFNVDEILATAEEIERNGATFYRTAAQRATDDTARDMLEELAGMENQHKQIFASLRAALTGKDKKPEDFDPDCARYLKALANKKIFRNKSIDMNSLGKVLTEAIATEKDSIAFYAGMQELIGAGMGRDKIDTIIKEEMAHLILLTDKLSQLN